MNKECRPVNSARHGRSLDPWCETHERSVSVCLRELRERAESAELGCEIAYRREPTQAEGDAHELKDTGECFVVMGGWTGRRCRHCQRWTWGGPTACEPCAEKWACRGVAGERKEKRLIRS